MYFYTSRSKIRSWGYKGMILSQKAMGCVLTTVLVAILLGSALAVPTFSAYADHDNGNGKSQDDKKDHKKDRKGEGPKDPQRCEHGASAKYNKHCS
jgi:hypothetical protein